MTQEWKDNYIEVRDHLSNLLDERPSGDMPSEIILPGGAMYLEEAMLLVEGVIPDKQTYTQREIMDVFIYGEISHANDDKRMLILEWKKTPKLFNSFYSSFINTVLTVLVAIWRVDFISNQELQEEPITNSAKPA